MHAGIRGISSFHIAVGGTSILIFPMLFIQSFKRLSWLNMIGFISTMVVTATMIVLVAVDPFRHHMPTQVCLFCCADPLAFHTQSQLCPCCTCICYHKAIIKSCWLQIGCFNDSKKHRPDLLMNDSMPQQSDLLINMHLFM